MYKRVKNIVIINSSIDFDYIFIYLESTPLQRGWSYYPFATGLSLKGFHKYTESPLI